MNPNLYKVRVKKYMVILKKITDIETYFQNKYTKSTNGSKKMADISLKDI